MDVWFATFAALFLLFGATSCAPAGLQDACVDVRSSSMALNQLAKRVSVKARNGSKDTADFHTTFDWMEEKDKCDPESLKLNPAPCLEKMLRVLRSYSSMVTMLSEFQSCAKFAREVEPAIGQLHTDMSRCVQSKIGRIPQMVAADDKPIARWEEEPLCHYTLDRLFSFSIITARVFAVGDPAHHIAGSAQRCT